MDGAINFTMGLSEGIAWPWPIAVYLFLAGISGGAVAVALMLNFFRHKTETTGRTHQKLSNEPRYRSPFIGDLTRGTF